MTPTITPPKNSTMTIRAILALIGVLGYASFGQAQSYTIMPQPFGLVQDNSGHIINGGCVWTYTAGTTTPAATYSDNAGTLNTNPIKADSAGRFTAFLLAGSSYKFVYENTPCTVSPPTHGPVLRTADTISSTPSSSATVDEPGTAGETLSAGNCAYLSDGSGGKNLGQWYKCDVANAYSSTTPKIGLVPSAIVSGGSGTIRLAGSVPGLSALSVGSKYYIGSAGALSSTTPNGGREVGIADSTTSLLVGQPTPAIQAWVDDFRLTLTSATPVPSTDVTAATTIICTPYLGNRLDLPDASGNPVRVTSAEFSIAVPATTATIYDIFAFNNAGVATLELLAWTNDTTRATAIIRTTTGRYYKTGDLTRLYLGSFRTTAVSGQTEDSAAKRYLYNYYNRKLRLVKRSDPANTWTYTTATIRQANGNTANQIDVVQGVAESLIDLTLGMYAANGAGALIVAVGIGEDSTTTFSANQYGQANLTIQVAFANVPLALMARLVTIPAVGRHFYAQNEYSQANNTTTWYSNDPLAVSNQRGGLIGWWEN